MDFGRQIEFLLDREDLPEKVGCRKESYFLEFMHVDVARDFAIIIIIIIINNPTSNVFNSNKFFLVKLTSF